MRARFSSADEADFLTISSYPLSCRSVLPRAIPGDNPKKPRSSPPTFFGLSTLGVTFSLLHLLLRFLLYTAREHTLPAGWFPFKRFNYREGMVVSHSPLGLPLSYCLPRRV